MSEIFDEPIIVFSFSGQVSIATDTKVFVVICFDRAARVLFGCSADEFFDFAKLHPYAGNLQPDFLLLMKLLFG